ncbi:hypothetical protein ACVILI_001934 [Mesorhizobium sp. USDA 4775]
MLAIRSSTAARAASEVLLMVTSITLGRYEFLLLVPDTLEDTHFPASRSEPTEGYERKTIMASYWKVGPMIRPLLHFRLARSARFVMVLLVILSPSANLHGISRRPSMPSFRAVPKVPVKIQ